MPNPVWKTARLEIELQGKLNQAFGRSRSTLNGGVDHAETSSPQSGCRHREVRVVEDVEEFRAELNARLLADHGPLEHGEVEIVDSRSAKARINASLVSESPLECATGGRSGKARCIEPL